MTAATAPTYTAALDDSDLWDLGECVVSYDVNVNARARSVVTVCPSTTTDDDGNPVEYRAEVVATRQIAPAPSRMSLDDDLPADVAWRQIHVHRSTHNGAVEMAVVTRYVAGFTTIGDAIAWVASRQAA